MLARKTLPERAKNQEGRYKILVLIERHVKASLSPAQFAVYSFIADRTFRFDKLWERVTAEQIAQGFQTNDGIWIHRGVNMSERHVHRIIRELIAEEYVLRKPWGRYGNAYQYAINLESDIFDGYEDNITLLGEITADLHSTESSGQEP